MSIRRARWGTMASLLLLAGCGGDSTGPGGTALVVDPAAVTLSQQDTWQLTLRVVDGSGTTISGAPVAFHSSDTTIATVSAVGLIRSVGPVGQATVTLTAGALTADVPVTVTATSTGLAVTPMPATMAQKTTLQIDARVLDAVGQPVPDAVITYASGTAAMATVSPTGLVTSLGPSGQVDVTVTSGSFHKIVTITITQVPTSINVASNPAVIGVGASAQLTGQVVDAVMAAVPGSAVTYTTTDASLITVTTGGLVTSVGGPGAATVTAAAAGLTASVPVYVTQTPPGVTITPNPATMPQKTTLQLHAVFADALGQTVPGTAFTYVSGSPTLATVSTTGLVTSVGPAGTVRITAVSGGKSASVSIAITPVPTAIGGVPSPLLLGAGRQLQLVPTILDAVNAPIPGAGPFAYSVTPGALLSVTPGGILSSVGPTGSGTLTVTSGSLQLDVAVTIVTPARPAGVIAATTPMSGAWGSAVSASGTVFIAGINSVLGYGALPGFGLATVATPIGTPTEVAFNHAGTRAWLSGAPVDGVTEYDATTHAQLGSIAGLGGNTYAVRVSPDDQIVYVGTSGDEVIALDAATRAVLWRVNVGGAVVHMILHPTAPLLYASTPGSVVELNLGTHAIRTIPISGHAQALAIAADGSELYIANENVGFNVYNLQTSTLSTVAACGAYGLVLTPDQTQLYLGCSGRIEIRDRATRALVSTILTGGGVRRLSITADGLTVIAPNDNGWVDFIQ